VTTGGSGIPRLQELSYLEQAAIGILDGVPFERLRRMLVDHMINLSEASLGTGNTAVLRNAHENPRRYVRNVSEALKELMKLGLLEKATLPSSADSAHLYRRTTFALTTAGRAWAELCRTDRRAAYDELTSRLIATHPQFLGYIRLVARGFVVPLAKWADQPEPRSRNAFIQLLARNAGEGLRGGGCGWTSSETEIHRAISEYVAGIQLRADGKGVDPFKRNQDFVGSCEEALVKFAFTSAGTPIDYISHEILRRWTRFLGLANFSYYVPEQPTGLRIWPTADTRVENESLRFDRRVGDNWRAKALEVLPEAYDQIRREDPTGSLWVPIYKVRANVCWKLQIQDSEFDRAVIEMGRGERSLSGAQVNLDPSQYGTVPPSERPLVVETRNGRRTFYSMSLVLSRSQTDFHLGRTSK
jgi:hypothetical protein